MPGLSVSAALAGRLSLSAVRRRKELAGIRGSMAMLGLQLSEFRDRRDDFSGYAPTIAALVSSGLVGYQPEKWCQRHGLATGAWPEELQDGLDVAPQIAARYGAPRPGSSEGAR